MRQIIDNEPDYLTLCDYNSDQKQAAAEADDEDNSGIELEDSDIYSDNRGIDYVPPRHIRIASLYPQEMSVNGQKR